MNFKSNVQVGAVFQLVVHKGDPEKPTKTTDWFHNIVLDSGLDRMSQDTWISGCTVSSDSSEPIATQSGFDYVIARSTTRNGSITGGHNTTDPSNPYIWNRVTYRFGEGVAAGNISSLGLGWGLNRMWNIARVRDANGDPTTITVLPDEYLDVQCEIRFYPQKSFSGSFSLLDKYSNVLSTHTYEGGYFYGYFGSDSGAINSAISISIPRNASGTRGCVLRKAPNLSNANLEVDDYSGTGATTDGYPTPRSVRGAISVQLNDAVGQHFGCQVGVALFLRQSHSSWGYKWKIDPPITKSNTQRSYYYFTINWDRYEPT